MNIRKFFIPVLIAVGAGSLFFSNYITKEVEEGRAQVQDGQQQVGKIDKLFSLNEYTKKAGESLTESARKQIDDGKKQILKYEFISVILKGVGALLIVAGIGTAIYDYKKTPTSKEIGAGWRA